jgi:hypothetical protein
MTTGKYETVANVNTNSSTQVLSLAEQGKEIQCAIWFHEPIRHHHDNHAE